MIPSLVRAELADRTIWGAVSYVDDSVVNVSVCASLGRKEGSTLVIYSHPTRPNGSQGIARHEVKGWSGHYTGLPRVRRRGSIDPRRAA